MPYDELRKTDMSVLSESLLLCLEWLMTIIMSVLFGSASAFPVLQSSQGSSTSAKLKHHFSRLTVLDPQRPNSKLFTDIIIIIANCVDSKHSKVNFSKLVGFFIFIFR